MDLSSQGVGDRSPLPQIVSLEHNYPNPFNMETAIMLTVPPGESGQLDIFDIGGRLVQDYYLRGASSSQRLIWNARDYSGHEVKSGVYFYRLMVGDKILTDKMILLR